MHNGEICFCDDEDYPVLSRFTWYMYGNKNKLYPACFMYGRNGTRKHIPMHQVVMGGVFGIDHIDRNVMNNQKSNLRPVTAQQNGWNTAKRMITRGGKTPSSIYKGVCKWINAKGETLWNVVFILTKKGETPVRYFRKNGFKTELEAAHFYNKEIIKYRGEYAYLNVLTEDSQVV